MLNPYRRAVCRPDRLVAGNVTGTEKTRLEVTRTGSLDGIGPLAGH